MSASERADSWALIYDGYSPEQQPLREAICALGNGFFITRGAAAEARAGGPHYPGTYIACAYNRAVTRIADRDVENEDLVNWPNWLPMTFRPQGGAWLDLDAMDVLEFQQELDLRKGLLERRLRVRDGDGNVTSLRSRRFVHMTLEHLTGLEWTITPENWSGPIEIHAEIDGRVTNSGVERYKDLTDGHIETLETGQAAQDAVFLTARTKQSRIVASLATRTRLTMAGQETRADRRTLDEADRIAQRLTVECEQGRPIRVEKIAALHTSRDRAISEPALASQEAVARAGSFDELLESHIEAWSKLWRRCDIVITNSDAWSQMVLRLHIFHLLQSVSPNTIDLDVGVPSRGWHGEAYRGHIFWDELFIFPMLDLRIPEITRALLMYRYRRLPAAMRAAFEAGFQGAMFPWQSGSDGREESQSLHLNPRSGRWIPDNSRLQRHVNAAIAYNIWAHYQATEDREFLSAFGAEMILQIARFWASAVSYNPRLERYEIHGVMGPDEYHDSYPGAETPGLSNNAYTNVMASWTLATALRALRILPGDRRDELMRAAGVDENDLSRWDDISRRLRICFHNDGIISQFESYETLQELDWNKYKREHGEVMRLDRILEAENDSPNRYKVAKQADALMLFYLFSTEQLGEIFERLGYTFNTEMIHKNIEYYLARTSHGSTLSHLTHAWVLARLDRRRSMHCFNLSLKSDVQDVQGGTTPEGIHLGAMAGSVDLLQRCYTGLEMRDDALWLNPRLPEELGEVRLRVRYRGSWLSIRLTTSRLAVRCDEGFRPAARIGFREQIHTLETGQTLVFDL